MWKMEFRDFHFGYLVLVLHNHFVAVVVVDEDVHSGLNVVAIIGGSTVVVVLLPNNSG